MKIRESNYIYIREHSSYNELNVCKLGITHNISNRDTQYATGEIIRGKFVCVYEIKSITDECVELNLIEKQLHKCFESYHVLYDGGTEFYNKQIINKIDVILQNFTKKYVVNKLTSEEINLLVHMPNTNKNNAPQNTLSNFEPILNEKKIKHIPNEHQQKIIDDAKNYFQSNDKGIIVLPCGTGKTLISLWISQKIFSNRILIGVPNLLLLTQWKKRIETLFGNDMKILIISGNTTIQNIISFVTTNNNYIILTTYSSSFKIVIAVENMTESHIFDFKILDECHHLATTNNTTSEKGYVAMHKILAKKQLGLTATLRLICGGDNNSISNDDTHYFGNVITKKSLSWGITNNMICDYNILTISIFPSSNEDILYDSCNDIEKMLFISAAVSLKCIHDGNSHHCLIYSNNCENSTKIIRYINHINKINDSTIFCSDLNSEMKQRDQQNILDQYNKSEYGILSIVYMLGEGYDNNLVDTVVFAESMTSNIRILQSALRSGRKNYDEPNKISKIIIPIIGSATILTDPNNNDFKKIKEVVCAMGHEDRTIIQKIKLLSTSINQIRSSKILFGQKNIETQYIEQETHRYIDIVRNIILNTINRTELKISYKKAKKIISKLTKPTYQLNKEIYRTFCETDYRLPLDPEKTFEKEFVSWFDYLNIKASFYSYDDCVCKIVEYYKNELIPNYIDNPHETLKILCRIDKMFPSGDIWTDCYNLADIKIMFDQINSQLAIGQKKIPI